MQNKKHSGFSLLTVVIAVAIIATISVLAINKISDFVTAIAIGMTGIITTALISALSANKNAKAQRKAELRKLKIEYYQNFIKHFTKRLAYKDIQDKTPQAIDMDSCVEINKLPLYASSEVIKFVQNLMEQNQAITSEEIIGELLILIRNDISPEKIEKTSEKIVFILPYEGKLPQQS